MDENQRTEPWAAQQVMYEALITSTIDSAERAVEMGMARKQILLSCKVSGVQDLIAVYRALAQRCNYPLHLGLTEAGMGTKGTVASTAALAVLLQKASATPSACRSRHSPVKPARKKWWWRLKFCNHSACAALARSVTACPGCGRTTSSTFQSLPKTSTIFCVPKCPCGASNIRVWKNSKSQSWAALSTALAKASTPILASACPAPAKRPPRRYLSTVKKH